MLDRSILRATIVALGIALGGLLVGVGVARVRSTDRFVTVKGVAEREVRADIAIWPLHITGADNDLTVAHARLTQSIVGVRAFLVRHGIDTSNPASCPKAKWRN